MGLGNFLNRILAAIWGGLNVDVLTSYVELINVIRIYTFAFFLILPLALSWDLPFAGVFSTTSHQIISTSPNGPLIAYVVIVTLVFSILKLGHYGLRALVRWADPDFHKRKKRDKDHDSKMEVEMETVNAGISPAEPLSSDDTVVVAPARPIPSAATNEPPSSSTSSSGSSASFEIQLEVHEEPQLPETSSEDSRTDSKSECEVPIPPMQFNLKRVSIPLSRPRAATSDGNRGISEPRRFGRVPSDGVLLTRRPPFSPSTKEETVQPASGNVNPDSDNLSEGEIIPMPPPIPNPNLDGWDGDSETENPNPDPPSPGQIETQWRSAYHLPLSQPELSISQSEAIAPQTEDEWQIPPEANDGQRIQMFSYVDENGNVQHYFIPGEEESIVMPEPDFSIHLPRENEVPAVEIVHKPQKDEPPPLTPMKRSIVSTRKFLRNVFDSVSLSDSIVAILAVLVTSYIGWRLTPFYGDLSRFMLWFVIAGSHFSLLKSPQPDTNSSRQDFARITPFTRSFYVTLLGTIILILDATVSSGDFITVRLYGVDLAFGAILHSVQWILIAFIPWAPLVYFFGILPQADTAAQAFLEQINMHLFGASGSMTLVGALVDLSFSLIILLISFWPAWVSGPGTSFLFSLYLGIIIGLSYFQSRISKDFSLWHLKDPPKEGKLRVPSVTLAKLLREGILSVVVIFVVTGLYYSTLFDRFHAAGYRAVIGLCIVSSWILYYIIPGMRSALPFKMYCGPFLLSREEEQFEPANKPAQIMWFDRLQVILRTLTITLGYPTLFLVSVSLQRDYIFTKFSSIGGTILLSVAGIRFMRGSFTDNSSQHLILAFNFLFFTYDARTRAEFFALGESSTQHNPQLTLSDYLVSAFLVMKMWEIVEKIDWIFSYSSPVHGVWNLFITPFVAPHVPAYFIMLCWSSLVSAAIYPLMGYGLYLMSWTRPVKFWEKTYTTRSLDSNQRLKDEDASATNPSFNSVFYEQMLVSLRQSLYEQISLGRLGNVATGDFFIVMNDRLTAFLHIVEIRGMEFKGTFCHEQELQKMSKETYNRTDLFSLDKIHFRWPYTLGVFDWLSLRWNSWLPVSHSLILQTYSISMNPLNTLLSGYDNQKKFVKFFVMGVIHYLLRHPKLDQWLEDPTIKAAMKNFAENFFCTTGYPHTDEDYDHVAKGLTLVSFLRVYKPWIDYGLDILKLYPKDEERRAEEIPLLCFMFSLACRHHLSQVSYNTNMISKYMDLFRGNFDEYVCDRDKWVQADPSIKTDVIQRGTYIALKLNQDQYVEDFDEMSEMWQCLINYESGDFACCYEMDPSWRRALINGVPELLSCRKSGSDYSVVTLSQRYMKFDVIKFNKECVRGLWAGQIQELVLFASSNSERASIQRLPHIGRNLINQSCDVPIGYPVYVSPIITSTHSGTHLWLDDMVNVGPTLRKRFARKKSPEGGPANSVNITIDER
ncbi:pecanex-like protein 2 [Planoprotostelium fungivorum]|uniref:Pecanex-like protein 2 n=1 Tax=Planoprotostelium fungivorum TaxID=1890364 RepID=A0A2P6N3X4_9EUKA|nr:pecanex-like protein 2 [Planoprotostelium fungivorum]